METPVKHSASELRAMLKEHKASMPRLSAKKPQLMEYATKMGLLKAAAAPLPPSPPPEAVPVQKKKSTTVVAPASSKELPAELKKPEAKAKVAPAKAAPAKSFSDTAKGGLAAYASFVAEKKARGMSHKEATAAWKARK